jgi:hypothetical protein
MNEREKALEIVNSVPFQMGEIYPAEQELIRAYLRKPSFEDAINELQKIQNDSNKMERIGISQQAVIAIKAWFIEGTK